MKAGEAAATMIERTFCAKFGKELVMPEDQKPRTQLWGVQNNTNEGVEIAFGQLKSRYNLPGYTQDTGVKLICQNTGPGASTLRDPLTDTGGVPIAASWYDYRVKIAGSGQDLAGTEEAPPDNYFTAAVFTLVYKDPQAKSGEVKLVIEAKTAGMTAAK